MDPLLNKLKLLVESAERETSDFDEKVFSKLKDEREFDGPLTTAIKRGYVLPAGLEHLENAKIVAAHHGLKLEWQHFDGQQHTFYNEASTSIWTYVITGVDDAGNKWLMKKYEGGTRGGGQTWIYINKEKMNASDFRAPAQMYSNASFPKPKSWKTWGRNMASWKTEHKDTILRDPEAYWNNVELPKLIKDRDKWSKSTRDKIARILGKYNEMDKILGPLL